MTDKVLMVGAGSWGTAMAVLLADAGAEVTLLGRRKEFMRELAERRVNETFLPGVSLPESISLTAERPALDGFDWCFCAVPTRFIRETFAALADGYPPGLPTVSLSKGIEQESLVFPTRILSEVTGAKHVLALSGPSHAEEVAARLPASVVAASGDIALARRVQAMFATDRFRVYSNLDIIGVELAGALKNVIAIAAGICDGLEYGDNAKSALMTRGIVEITRFGTACGAERETFAGLAGMGDLITTCISPYGRNRMVGERLGRGETLTQILESMDAVAEGVTTTKSVYDLAQQKGIEMPITGQVYRVLFEGCSPEEATESLMMRPQKRE